MCKESGFCKENNLRFIQVKIPIRICNHEEVHSDNAAISTAGSSSAGLYYY